MSSLGRLLYPKLHRSARRKRMRALRLAILVGITASSLFAALLLLLNRSASLHNRPARTREPLPLTK